MYQQARQDESNTTFLSQILSTIAAIVARFFFLNNYRAYMYMFVCTGDDYSCILQSVKNSSTTKLRSCGRNFAPPELNFVSWKRNFVLMTRNFVRPARNFATKFRLMPRNFVSTHHIACEISPTLEQQKNRNFAAFSSETKLRNLIAEIRVVSLISANCVCISFAQYCRICLQCLGLSPFSTYSEN